MPAQPDPAAEAAIAAANARTGVDFHRTQQEVATRRLQDAYVRLQQHLQQHAAKQQAYLREIKAAEERREQELTRWADLVSPQMTDTRREIVELDFLQRRAYRSARYDDIINRIPSGCATPRGSVARLYDNHVEPPADNPNQPPAESPDVPPAESPDNRDDLVPPPPPTPMPPGASMPPAQAVAQQAPQMVDALRPLFPGPHVDPLFREHEQAPFRCPDTYVVAAQRVSCLLALHNEVGFEVLREALCREAKDFEAFTTPGNGEQEMEFKALSLLLLTRVAVTSRITDNHFDGNHIDHHIADNPFGPLVGSAHSR